VTGGGIPLGRFQQLFVLAYTNGKRQPAQWAQYAWKILTLQGQKLLKDGNTLESAEENMAELTAEAEVFFEKQLQILKSLQIL
jgi:phage terminase small subunit